MSIVQSTGLHFGAATSFTLPVSATSVGNLIIGFVNCSNIATSTSTGAEAGWAELVHTSTSTVLRETCLWKIVDNSRTSYVFNIVSSQACTIDFLELSGFNKANPFLAGSVTVAAHPTVTTITGSANLTATADGQLLVMCSGLNASVSDTQTANLTSLVDTPNVVTGANLSYAITNSGDQFTVGNTIVTVPTSTSLSAILLIVDVLSCLPQAQYQRAAILAQ